MLKCTCKNDCFEYDTRCGLHLVPINKISHLSQNDLWTLYMHITMGAPNCLPPIPLLLPLTLARKGCKKYIHMSYPIFKVRRSIIIQLIDVCLSGHKALEQRTQKLINGGSLVIKHAIDEMEQRPEYLDLTLWHTTFDVVIFCIVGNTTFSK